MGHFIIFALPIHCCHSMSSSHTPHTLAHTRTFSLTPQQRPDRGVGVVCCTGAIARPLQITVVGEGGAGLGSRCVRPDETMKPLNIIICSRRSVIK